MQRDDLSPRTFQDYYRTCDLLLDQFGKERRVEDLRPDDFRKFRSKLATRMDADGRKAHVGTIFFRGGSGNTDKKISKLQEFHNDSCER